MITETLYKIYDKSYCCVFCSHGETAELTRTTSTGLDACNQSRVKYSFTCSFCKVEYPIYDLTAKSHDISTKEILNRAMDVMLKYVEFNEHREDFIIAR